MEGKTLKTKTHKILALLLALIMVLSTPLSVFAEGDVSAPDSVETEAPAEPAQEDTEEEPAVPVSAPEPEESPEEIADEETAVIYAIIEQPQDAEAYANDEVGFMVGTAGEVKSYQWQYSRNGADWYNYSGLYGGKSDTLTVKASSNKKYLYRSIVVFADGTSAVSEAAKITILESSIKEDPADSTVERGKQAAFSVAINGTIVSVQWQVSYNNGRRWTNLSQWIYGSAETLRFTAGKEDNGALIRAIVSTKDGKRLTSAPAKLTVVKKQAYPAMKDAVALGNTKVAVDAPAEALPEGTALEVKEVASKEVREQVESVVDGTITDMLAFDISFTSGEPQKEVSVSITAEEIAANAGKEFTLVHIKDNGEVEKIDNATIEDGVLRFSSAEFSTYVLTWTEDEEEKSAQIHWGQMANGAWDEFNKASVDDSTGNFSLRGLYEGYTFVQAYYSADELTDPTTGTAIEPYITKAESGVWQYDIGGAKTDIADGGHIYAVYVENGSEGAPPVITPPANTDPLNTQKTVVPNGVDEDHPNGDGTYKITLSVTGDQVVSSVPRNANVVLVLDQSISMRENVSSTSNTARYTAVRNAARTLIADLPANGSVEMTILTFGTGAQTRQDWMTINSASDKTTLRNVVDQQMTNGNCNAYGTNWDGALDLAATKAAQKANSEEATFIIFLTDGCPSCNSTDPSGFGQPHAHGSDGTTNPNDRCITFAMSRMDVIVDAGYTFYGIYANTTSNSTHVTANGTTYSDPLAYLISASGAENNGGGYTEASNEDDLSTVFSNIAANINSYLGYNNVQVNDGVTNLTNISAAVSTAGPAGNFEYKRDGGTNLDGTKKYDNETWSGAPAAQASDTGVTWDLKSAGNLEAGVTYSVSFDIWPSQDAYDLVADLNNGKRSYEPGHANSITAEERAQIGGTGPNGYYLLTNTFLNTTYTFEGDPDTTYTVVGNKGTNAMPLDSEVISLLKFWPENQLDTYEEGQSQDGIQTQITLTVTKDGANYIEKTLEKPNQTDSSSGWVPQVGQEEVYISCGVMTVKDGVVEIMDGSEGHDYTIKEPGIFSYYWDLIADVYHPMVINGKKTMLVLDKTKTAQDVANGVYQIGTDSKGNPRYFRTEPGEVTVGDDGTTTTTFYMKAHNYRRSNLNLTKSIVDPSDVADSAYFTYEVVVTDAANADVWFSAYDPTIPRVDGEGNPELDDNGNQKYGATVTEDWVISGATAENGGTTGYWYATSGATIKFKIKAGWNVRFLNLLHDSEFYFKETGMDDGFTFNSIDGSKKFEFEDTTLAADAWITTNDSENYLIKGTIVEPNNSYTVTFKNNYTAYFYVYHTKNNTVEKIANTDTRVEKGDNGEMTFNIAYETLEGTLYGGYFNAYGGALKTAAEIKALTFTTYEESQKETKTTYDGTHKGGIWAQDSGDGVAPYTGDKVNQFKNANAYKVDPGTAMHPENGGIYYLKEVPDQYFRPATFVTYNDMPNKDLKKLYLLTVADDALYQNAGLIAADSMPNLGTTTRLYSTFKVTMEDGTEEAFVAKTVNTNLKRGYLAVWDAKSLLEAGTYTFTPYYVTKDGVTVTGVGKRTITIRAGLGREDFEVSDSVVASTCTYSVGE